jgi:tryptophan halogenase
MTDAPRQIVIVGRDAALWLTAAALGEALRPIGVQVTAVELPSNLGLASAYTTLPAIEALHGKLGFDEAALLRTTGGSFSLGWNVVRPDAAPFLLAHGAYGAPIEGGDFFSHWLKARRHGLNASYEDFSPTAMAARHGRLLLPDEETERFGRCDYAYHLPAIPYVSLLKSRARKLGVAIHQTRAVAAERDGVSGSIRSITPEGEDPIPGDLFIDASGPEAALIGKEMGVGIESWRSFFPTDRLLTARGQPFPSVPTYAEIKLAENGWTALQANQAATNVVHAFNAERQSSDQAFAAATAAAGMTIQDAAVEIVEPGLRSAAWAFNCVAIGGAACALDPLFGLDLHAAQLGIVHLLSLFPTTAAAEGERTEYNRISRSHFERLRDFQAAPYVLTGAAQATPETLLQKLDSYRARGTIAPMEDETFTPDQWRALFIGLGLEPDSWPPAIDQMPPDRMKESFRRILGFVRTKVLDQPTQDNYLAEIGAGIAA